MRAAADRLYLCGDAAYLTQAPRSLKTRIVEWSAGSAGVTMTVETPAAREPVFNIPGVVLWLAVALAAIHVARWLFLSPEDDRALVLALAFIPARYGSDPLARSLLPGGDGADIWSVLTYGALHADAMHLGFNLVWLLAFGSPVARRFGPARFMVLTVVTTAAGALAHFLSHTGDLLPVIGASAAISGMMGAASRFVFEPGGQLDRWRPGVAPVRAMRAAPLWAALRNPRVLIFVGVWFALNLVFGVGAVSLTGEDAPIAWQAHAGGFLAGLLLFGWIDPPLPQEAFAQRDARGEYVSGPD